VFVEVGTGVSVTVGVSVLYTGVGVNGVLVDVLLAVGVCDVVGGVGAQGGTNIALPNTSNVEFPIQLARCNSPTLIP
jgi:hypothetical protein